MSATFARTAKDGRRYQTRGPIFGREVLTSVRDAEGNWHAHYPTALATLCGRRLAEAPIRGRRFEPDCAVCVTAALNMDRIDGSVPRHWRNVPDEAAA